MDADGKSGNAVAEARVKIDATYENEKDKKLVTEAYDYAEKMHEGQKRASGEPYFVHPCSVANILMDMGLDAPTVAAAFLHDVVEDTAATEEDIREKFGEEVEELVAGVTKLNKIVFESKEQEEAENFRKIVVAMAKDIRVIIIKLADRLHNMRSLAYLSPERQQAMAHETLEIYTPLAGRLGISHVKSELEDLCLKYLDPEAYRYLLVHINEKLSERRQFVADIVEQIKDLMKADGIVGEVFGRPKHFYSIYKKMKNKGKAFDQIYDLTAVRVIVKDVKECYTVLGAIHEKWTPLPGRIKDYIANPKPNKYQSLHTTVMTSYGQPFEIQIRTEEMHRVAEFGIAAHWKYKEGKSQEQNTNFESRLTWLREMVEWQSTLKDSREFLDALKTELYSEELLVFTPRGNDGFLILLYKGIRYPVEIVSRRQNEYEILLNGVAYTFSVETPFSLKRKRLLAGRQGEVFDMTIKSPMPGKILDVSIEVGQEINKGDTLVVLEAMKMQNVIIASQKGRVRRVCVVAGQTVSKDEILVEIGA